MASRGRVRRNRLLLVVSCPGAGGGEGGEGEGQGQLLQVTCPARLGSRGREGGEQSAVLPPTPLSTSARTPTCLLPLLLLAAFNLAFLSILTTEAVW